MLNIMLMRRLMPHFVPSCGLITNNTKVFIKTVLKSFLPIVLALCLMLSETYYAQNHADIIDLGQNACKENCEHTHLPHMHMVVNMK